MPNVDERIREEMHGLERTVQVDGVLERVSVRRARRRVVRRVQAAALAVAVVGGSVAGGLGLMRLFGHQGTTGPASQFTPKVSGPNPTSAGGSPQPSVKDAICQDSQLNADLDGDGALDQVDLLTLAPNCDSPGAGQHWVLHVSGGKIGPSGPGVSFYGADQDFADCQQPGACRLFAAPDINGDGQAELAIQLGVDVNTQYFGLYELEGLDTAGGPRFVRIQVVVPGDPDSGLTGGVALFAWGGSPFQRLKAVECRGDGFDRILVVSTGVAIDAAGTRYDVHEGQLSFRDGELHVVATADYPDVAPDDQPPFVLPSTLCGSPLVKG